MSVSVSLPFEDWTVYFSDAPIELIVQLAPTRLQLTPAELFVTVGVPLVSVVTVDTSVPAQTGMRLAVGPRPPAPMMFPVTSVETIALLAALPPFANVLIVVTGALQATGMVVEVDVDVDVVVEVVLVVVGVVTGNVFESESDVRPEPQNCGLADAEITTCAGGLADGV